MASIHIRTRLAAALLALAVAAPVAAARPIHGVEHSRTATPAAAAPVQKVVVTRDRGFDWTDAAIGGAVAVALLGVTGTGVLIARRPDEDTGSAVGAH